LKTQTLLTLVLAAGLSLTLYLAVTSIPFLLQSASTDPVFGAHNACLQEAMKEPRVGFAVSPGAQQVAAYGGGTLVVCRRDARGEMVSRRLELKGITGATFDFSQRLWLTTLHGGLWRWEGEEKTATRVGEVRPTAIVGHTRGVMVLEPTGKVLSVSDGEVTGWDPQVGTVGDAPVLAVNGSGTLGLVLTPTGLFVYDAQTSKTVYSGRPCQVSHAWWSAANEDTVILACAPSSAMELHVRNGEHKALPQRERTPSFLVPGLKKYAQACNALPCTAPDP